MVLLGMLLVGAITVYLSALQAASRSGAQVSSTARAAVTLAQILDISRECYGLALPTDASGFMVPVAGTTVADYLTSDGSAAALLLTAPGTGAVSVVNSAGAAQSAGADFAMTYAKNAGTALTIYRSDSTGLPSPNAGQYLWAVGTPPGQAALPAGGQKVAKLSETAFISANTPDAVTFLRTPGANVGTPSVEIHLIAGDYSAVSDSKTSENTSSQVVGKCVLLRNHP